MVTILFKPEANQFIRRKGSDFLSKETLIHAGEKLNGPRIALMASQGISEVTVNRRPSIGYVLSGNELVLPGESMQPGSIRSCNGELFETLLAPWAEEVVGYGKIGDSLEDVLGSLDLALPHDIFLISGGASVGDYDFTRRALKERGFAIHFEQVAIRPGKPLIFATKDDHAVFGVPGNPVSTVVTCLMFLQVAAAAFSGQRLEPKRFMARLENSQKKPQDLSVYARGNFRVVNQENLVKIDSNQSSGAIGAFTKANCLVSLPAGRSEFQTGDLVAIVPIEDGIPWN
ncbi:MAG: molybdopterin molybdotransferase MoeA, partial [Candidatus Cloacimonetes bacterium]|nr:molybdopterin molybdotransferase MoeA [Candidatus Cloacimonadota bacterium]